MSETHHHAWIVEGADVTYYRDGYISPVVFSGRLTAEDVGRIVTNPLEGDDDA